MDKETLFVALSNQKGGVGKSAFTILLASYFHYVENLNVAVIDCDSPQHSLVRMRERDKKAIDRSDHYKQQMMAQWERIKKKAYPIIGVRAEKAREAADELVKNSEHPIDLVLVDLPGTVDAQGVFRTIVNMDYVITPITADKMVKEERFKKQYVGRADRGIRQPDPIHGRAKRGSKAEESENRAL